MRTYLISYDLSCPETSLDYFKVINYIKSLGEWMKPLKSQFLVVTNESAIDIVNNIMSLTDSNDKIMVIDVTDDTWATARFDTEYNSWMNTYVAQ